MPLSDKEFDQQLAYCREREKSIKAIPQSQVSAALNHWGSTILDRAGNHIELGDYIVLKNDLKYSIIEQTQVGPFWVSTVWIGMVTGGPGKLRFESMVMSEYTPPGGEDLTEWNDQDRYGSEEEARAGHLKYLKKYEELASSVVKNKSDLKKWLENPNKSIRQWAIKEMAILAQKLQDKQKPKATRATTQASKRKKGPKRI